MGQSCCCGSGRVSAKVDYNTVVDLTRATGYDIHQLRNWYYEFVKDYPSGHVTKKQFLRLYSLHFSDGKPETKREATQIFQTFDQNKDGTIDFREFMIAVSILSQGSLAQKLTAAFEFYDINGDGILTLDEIQNIVKMMYYIAHQRGKIEDLPEPNTFAQQLFDELDQDKNGEITLEEFINVGSNDQTMADLLLSNADETEAWQ